MINITGLTPIVWIDPKIKETANGNYVRNVMDLFFSCFGG